MNRERIPAALNYESYDRLPVIHFGFLPETLKKWHLEGHLSDEQFKSALCADEDTALEELTQRLGFDCGYHRVFVPAAGIDPPFVREVVEELPDGARKVITSNGAIVIEKDDAQHTDGV